MRLALCRPSQKPLVRDQEFIRSYGELGIEVSKINRQAAPNKVFDAMAVACPVLI